VLPALLLAIGSYALGCLPQVYLLGRLRGVDLRQEPDLHIALWQTAKWTATLAVLVDLAKGVTPVLVGRALGLGHGEVAVAGLMVVLGQMWPLPFLNTGGRGNSTGIPMALTLVPAAFRFTLIPLGLALLVRLWEGPHSRSLPLGMAVAFATLPLASYITRQPLSITLALLGLFLAIIIRRLTAGLWADLKVAPSRKSLFLNRVLFDRSS
jgi:glycerol-3-phosphate acyltransferase PlsY